MIFIQLACTWIHPNDVRLPSLEDLHPNPENLIMVTVPMKWNLSPTPPDKKTAKHFRKVHCFAHLSRFARNAVNRKKKHHQRSTTLWSFGASAWHQCVRRQSWSSTQTKKKFYWHDLDESHVWLMGMWTRELLIFLIGSFRSMKSEWKSKPFDLIWNVKWAKSSPWMVLIKALTNYSILNKGCVI